MDTFIAAGLEKIASVMNIEERCKLVNLDVPLGATVSKYITLNLKRKKL
jgi:hypothetical protein